MRKYLILVSISLACFSSSSQINEEYNLQIASKSVINWLNNLNTTNYAGCYEEMSLKIKSKVDSLVWIDMATQELIIFGEFNGRKEISRKFAINPLVFDERLTGFPDGYYVVFVFSSNYSHWDLSKDHIETLFLHQDYKSRWRILEYSYSFTFKDDVEDNYNDLLPE